MKRMEREEKHLSVTQREANNGVRAAEAEEAAAVAAAEGRWRPWLLCGKGRCAWRGKGWPSNRVKRGAEKEGEGGWHPCWWLLVASRDQGGEVV